jgi:hypothetical protein
MKFLAIMMSVFFIQTSFAYISPGRYEMVSEIDGIRHEYFLGVTKPLEEYPEISEFYIFQAKPVGKILTSRYVAIKSGAVSGAFEKGYLRMKSRGLLDNLVSYHEAVSMKEIIIITDDEGNSYQFIKI